MRRVLSLFLAICFLTITFTSCSSNQPTDASLINKRINVFLSAFNMGNEEEIIKCFSAAEQKRIADDHIEDAFWVAVAIGLGIETVGDTAKVDDITLTISDGDIGLANGTEAYANVSLQCFTDGDSYSSEVYFLLVKEKGDWFIENYQKVG